MITKIPYPIGFKGLAGKFVDALRVEFPGRIEARPRNPTSDPSTKLDAI